MIICVEGTRSFNNYETFMRAIGVALSGVKPNSEVVIWTVGPHKINNFTAEFANIVENYLKSHKVKIRFMKVTRSYVELRLDQVDYFVFLCNRNEKMSPLAKEAEELDREVGIFRA